jgi:hypothetical protein
LTLERVRVTINGREKNMDAKSIPFCAPGMFFYSGFYFGA